MIYAWQQRMQTPDLFHPKTKLARLGQSVRPARRRGLIWLALAMGLGLSAVSGRAATINWGTPVTISGDSDVTNAGTGIGAYFEGGAGANQTINGVTFTNMGGTTTWGNLTFSGSGTFAYNTNGMGNNVGTFASLSAAYSNALSGGIWIPGNAAVTVTLNNLTVGHQYTVQYWANDSRYPGVQTNRYSTISGNWGSGNKLLFNTTHVAGGVGQYVLGTFLADATSQAFVITGGNLTSGGSADAQTAAIQVRDNGAYVYTPPSFTATRVNLAKYQPVTTDSTNGSQGAQFITDGLTVNDSYWQSGGVAPHWAQVTFPFPVPVGSVQLAMGLDSVPPPTIFKLQYLTNGTWMNVPGTSVGSNTNKEVNLVFTTPITASSFRFYDSLDGNVYIREMALYPPNGTNGYPFGTDFNIDLARKQPTYATANTYGNWPLLATDGRVNAASAWETTLVGSNALQINLQFTNTIGSAHLYSGATGVPPLTNFVLQYWTAGAWANIPGGSVTGNTNGALVIPFTTPVTTTKVQLVFTNAGVSAVQELCIFSANSNGGYPLGTGVTTNLPVAAKYDTYTDSYYYLSNSATAQVIIESNGVPVPGPAAGTNWAGQYQVLLNYDNGSYRLINRNTGLCLAGAQLTTNAGAALVDEDYAALPDQDWFLQPIDGVNYYLVNQFSGLGLDQQGGALVQNVPTNRTSQYWQISPAKIFPKKGIAGSWGGYPVTFAGNWTYGWWYGSNPNLPGVNYFPMDPDTWYRGSTVAGNLWTLQPGWRKAGYSLNVMGYNEPDMVGQADIDATNGAIYWMNDQNLDLPLAGPAAGNVNGTWNQIFYGYITNWGCHVDYLPAHEYPGNNSSGSSGIWINTLNTAYNTYGIPMWMTEFGVVDWGGTGYWNEEDNYTAMAEFLWRAESVTWLRKYSMFIFRGAMATNLWTRTTPAPTSNAYDTNGVLTPFGELYAAWDDDANVETNKAYFVFNSSTRKQLANLLDPQYPDAKSILVRDSATQWTLQPAPTTGKYYLVSALDGRRLSYNGTNVTLAAPGTTGTTVQWSLASYQYGWYYLQHPATGKELSLAYNNSSLTATYSMVTNTTTGTAVEWRFIVPYTPPVIVWTGGTNASWISPANWDSINLNPIINQRGDFAVAFNNLSTNNLNTVLNFANNPAVSNNFTVYGITVSNPPGPVTIEATNTLTVGNFIDLSGASQNLTINSPLFIGEQQGYARHFWTVASTRTLSLNGGVTGANDLIIAGGGTVSLGGTNTYTGNTIISNNTLLTISGAGQLGGGNYTSAITDNGTFNYNSAADQTLSGNISGTGSVTVNGMGNLTLSGTNTYTGNTTINSGGTLALSGSGWLASQKIIVAGGGTFDISATTTTFTFGSGVKLTNSSAGALINGNNDCTVGTLWLVTDGINPAFIQTNGTMTLSASAVFMVNNTGTILGVGHHTIIAAATAGNQGRVTGPLPSVAVTGSGTAGTVALQTNATGGLDLVVTSSTSTSPTSLNFGFSSGALTLTWPADHLGWIAQSNAVNLGNSNYWFDIPGSESATNLSIPIKPAVPQVFYRLRYPF